MNLISWIIVGGLAGWLSTKIIAPKKKKGCFANIIIGIIGAFIGGYIASIFGEEGVTGFNLYSVIIATLGAVVLIWVAKKVSA